jgi:hypothetical protein
MNLMLSSIRIAIFVIAVLPLASAADPIAKPGLEKSGEKRLRVFGISIYTASLCSSDERFASESDHGPLLLSIEYHRNVSKARIMKSTDKEWSRLGRIDDYKRQSWLAAPKRILPDVAAGDRPSSLVMAGGETTFYLGDVAIGTASDPEFGPAFLTIWLDPDSRFPKQRRKLLVGMNGRIPENFDFNF